MRVVMIAAGCAAALAVGAAPAIAAGGSEPAAGGAAVPVSYDSSFVGYGAEGALRVASAEFTVPRVACTSTSPQSGVTEQLVMFAHNGKFTYGAIEIGCNAGVVTHTAAIVLNGGPLQEIKESTVKVAAGDVIKTTVKEGPNGTAVTVRDLTSNTAKTQTKPHGYKMYASQYGDGALDVYTNGQLTKKLPLARFTPDHFTHVTENGKRIGTDKLLGRFTWTANGTAKGRVDAVASALKGKDAFTVTFKHAR
jgi:hypothetical protein